MIRSDESIDAWVLMAVGSSLVPWRGRSLVGIVGMLDAIERAYPTAQEFEGAIGRLHARDLIRVRDDRVRLSADGRVLLRTTRGGRGFLNQWKRLEVAFGDMPAAKAPPESLLLQGAFDRALREYLMQNGLE